MKLNDEWKKDEFVLLPSDEDIHTANERRLKVTLFGKIFQFLSIYADMNFDKPDFVLESFVLFFYLTMKKEKQNSHLVLVEKFFTCFLLPYFCWSIENGENHQKAFNETKVVAFLHSEVQKGKIYEF